MEHTSMIRLLRADEIECRVNTMNEKGLTLLLYKDARADQKILDETFTPFGWQRSHQVLDDNLYCTVEIWDEEKGQWIAKQDVGTMSYSEKEKGQASDSFKRACFNWGIGRELYTAPFIWVSAEKAGIQKNDNKCYTREHFSVQSIAYDKNRCISGLVLVNSRREVVYRLGESQIENTENVDREEQKGTGSKTKKSGKKNVSVDFKMTEFQKELERTGVPLETVLDRYHIQSTSEMTEDIYQKAMNCLKRSKDKAA